MGNTRAVFTKGATGVAETVQEDHYYPFGLQLSGQSFTNTTLLNKYLFNGKEKQDQTGMYDYGFRQMDPVLGRWFCVDRMAEKYLSTSPYVYVFDNPMRFIDPDGLDPMYTSQPWVVDWYADGQDEDWDVNNGVETLLHDGPGHAITSSCNTSLPKPDDNEKPNEYEDTSWWQSLSEDMTTQGERSARQEAHDESAQPDNYIVDKNGHITLECTDESDPVDHLYVRNDDGSIDRNNSITVEKDILNNINHGTYKYSVNGITEGDPFNYFKSSDDLSASYGLFIFLAKNTRVEFGLTQLGNGSNYISTQHSTQTEAGSAFLLTLFVKYGVIVNQNTHDHPFGSLFGSSTGIYRDEGFAAWTKQYSPGTGMYMYDVTTGKTINYTQH